MAYNLLTCGGFGEVTSWFAGGGCLSARMGLVLLFFLIAIVRKWGAEEWGIPFNFVFSLIGGVALYLILVTLTGSFKLAFGIGILAALILGYGGGSFFGGSDSDE